MNLEITRATSERDKSICFRLRHIVFVEEQGVPVELELDEFDENGAVHFLGRLGDEPIAASRIRVFDDVAKIQRVVVLKDYRGNNFGHEIMQHMIAYICAENLAPTIALDAQTYAMPFYQALGFIAEGEEFDDAGILHVRMVQKV